MLPRSLRLLPFTLLLAAGGCYMYAPISAATVAPGTSLRARITASHAEQIAPLLGGVDARLLTGKLIDTRADTLIIEVATMERVHSAGVSQSLNQRLGIPRSEILELETRTLNRRRTTILAGAAAFVVASFLVKTLIIDPGGERGPIDGGGPELRPRDW